MDEPFATLFSKRWGWLTIWGICFCGFLLLVLVMVVAKVHPWSDIDPTRITWYHQEECEQVTPTSFLLQVFNFWSNFAYLAAGLLIVWLSTSHIGRLVGVVFIMLAIGSGWFHGTLTEFGQTVDIVGVYAALAALIAYAIVELFEMDDVFWPLDQISFPVLGLLLGCLVLSVVAGILRGAVGFFKSDYFTPMLVIILFVYMVVLIWKSSNGVALVVHLLITVAIGVLALIFKFTDGDDNGLAKHHGDFAQCSYSPGGLIQGHALWHILSALMFVLMFEYIRYVRERSQSVFPWRVEN